MATTPLDIPQRAVEAAVLRQDNPRALVGELGERILLFSADNPVCDRVVGPCATVAIEEAEGLDTAADRACQTAVLAHLYGHTPLDARDVLPLVRFLEQTNEGNEDFLHRSLGALHSDPRNAHLLTTLKAYLHHGMSTAATARSLFIHRHTLDHRLRRIRHLTGLDLTQPLHRLRAEIALLLTTP
ncbi:helix-turn-helix domain-containing protein [Streptomyces sp. NPDC050147]|uniref:PucR family transcriptional regulator n=1 Tax=Streptomyces sp. NPDC050147 TaxID=3155513 RepID=UPI0034135388